jgi:DNA end-binding protein Ku
MAARSIASLSLSFGLVSIPVKLYSATESAAGVHFNLLAPDGSRVKQQYVSERTQQVVPRAEMIKGYEFEKDRYVTFTPAELKALEEGSRTTIDIVAFIPLKVVEPVFYDKAYYLAPDKRGAKPYHLLREAMRETGLCALAQWAWKGKQYVVQVRPEEDGLVLQQLLYADEVRRLSDLDIEQVDVSPAELKLAIQLVEQLAKDAYDPSEYRDEEKQRVLAAIDEKIAGKQIVAHEPAESEGSGAQVIDLMEALRASLGQRGDAKAKGAAPQRAPRLAPEPAPERTPDRTPERAPARAPRATREVEAAAAAEAVSTRKPARRAAGARAAEVVEAVAAPAPAPRKRAAK